MEAFESGSDIHQAPNSLDLKQFGSNSTGEVLLFCFVFVFVNSFFFSIRFRSFFWI